MKSPAPFPYTLLQTPADALLSWLDMVAQKGAGHNGIVFTRCDRDADCYLKAADRVMPGQTVRVRQISGSVTYDVSGCIVSVEILRRPSDYLCYCASRQFICFDNPFGWPDDGAIVSLKARVALPATHVVAVGSHIMWTPPSGARGEPKPGIDYSAITRAVSD